MLWKLCLAASCAILALTLLLLLTQRKLGLKRLRSPFRVLFAGSFLSAVLLFIPIYAEYFEPGASGVFKTILISVHNTMRLFVMDGEFDFMQEFTTPTGWGLTLYHTLGAVLYVLNPLLTFGFVLSFFQSASAYQSLVFHYFSDFYIFSELNPRALALAESLRAAHPHALLIFCDVFASNDEPSYELGEQARELGAICFKQDITAIRLGFHSRRARLCFFTIGMDEAENIEQSLCLRERFQTREHTRLYVFSSGAQSEYLFQEAPAHGIKVRRVNPVRSLIDRTLYYGGETLFAGAAPQPDGTRKIGVVLLGLGQLGTEMLRALPWFCQMDGYDVEIHAFDRDEDAESRITALCPELMDAQHNGVAAPGESHYKIVIHSGVDTAHADYPAAIRDIPVITHAFILLGSDEDNIRAAVQLRTLCERRGCHPHIQAKIVSAAKKDSLSRVTDYRGHAYDIDFFGDLQSSFSESVILGSELEQEALSRHLKWGAEPDFWAYEFNYRSSVATAIHRKMRIFCGIPGSDKREEDLTPAERGIIESLEHRRWNAYMRADGYIYSGSRDKKSRNDLGKMHPDLVPFDVLTEEDKRKDSRIGTV